MSKWRTEVQDGLRQLTASQWDALTHGSSPFLEYPFLASLEEAECVGEGTGWQSLPLTLSNEEGEFVAGCPLYLKRHSMGEFVYDWAFADAAQRHGLPYYPKAIIAAPFSPIPGHKLLVHENLSRQEADAARKQLLEGAIEVAQQAGCHSVHLLFCTAEEAKVAQQLGFFTRIATQLHWRNEAYGCFDDFLQRFRSKRRKAIRRERRQLAATGLSIEALAADQIPDELCPAFFRFYTQTVSRFMWGRQYLNPRFFELLWERFRHRIQVTVARQEGKPVAGTLNFERNGRRHGRYWGTDVEIPHLHFELTAYAAIEDCIERRLNVFEAGAGDYPHKLARGFLPTITRSVHLYFHDDFHRSVQAYCTQEAAAIRQSLATASVSPFIR